jgi:enediyne biosynthesis protein E4
LTGPPGNPNGIGATLRRHTSDTVGPARAVQAGSGYWSQDSAIQVLASPKPPTQISVRWPGGKTAALKIPQGAREVSINLAGELKVVR